MAKTVVKDGIKYELNEGYACVVDYTEDLQYVIVPDKIKGLPVTIIGTEAFINYTSLISIMLPNSIKFIGCSAFENCTSLISITIPDSVTGIDDNAFNGCESLERVTISGSVTYIGDEVFSDCTSLISIAIPNNVIDIGNFVFWGCCNLKYLYISKLKNKIVKHLFKGVDVSPEIYFKGYKKDFIDMFDYDVFKEHIATNEDCYDILTIVHCADGDLIC